MARSASPWRLASVDSSCTSRLRSSGLSITASSWPCFTASPATTLSVTVPAAIAYRVGLLAVMTRPSADRSRTRSPRVTLAMRTRDASTERLPPDQAEASQTASSSTATAAPPMASQRVCRRRRRACAGRTVSWAEVSRMRERCSMSEGRDACVSARVACKPRANHNHLIPKEIPCGRTVRADAPGVRPDARIPYTAQPLQGIRKDMCGIVGAIADRDVVPVLIDGLKRLEYRGYDSAGIALVDGGDVRRVRRTGRVLEMEAAAVAEGMSATLGIGHTRWATHGGVTEANAHPHISHGVALVHNGIIENHEEQRARLLALGYAFESQTDTEVIAHLIHYYLTRGDDLLGALQRAVRELHGAYALA